MDTNSFGVSSLFFLGSAYASTYTCHLPWITMNCLLPFSSFLYNHYPASTMLLDMDYATIFLLGFVYSGYQVWLCALALLEISVCRSISHAKNVSFSMMIYEVLMYHHRHIDYYIPIVIFTVYMYYVRRIYHYKIHTLLWHMCCTHLLCQATQVMLERDKCIG